MGGGCDPFKRMHVRDPILLGVSRVRVRSCTDDGIPQNLLNLVVGVGSRVVDRANEETAN